MARTAVAAAAITLAVGTISAPARAGTTVVASWQMNEAAGVYVLHDSGPLGINGTIGTSVGRVTLNGVNAFHWSDTAKNSPPAQPERLVTVNHTRLNPGTAEYSITLRYRSRQSGNNILQKGQATTPGVYWKIQQPMGRLTCLFRDENRNTKSVKSPQPLNDGAWHTVKCTRTATAVLMWIDGRSTPIRANGTTGRISNSVPLAIGGKKNCDQVTITCDYFVGDIDWVKIEVA